MIELRVATAADYEYARRIHHTAYREMVLRQFGQWEEPVQDRFFEKSWGTGSYAIILFEGEPCGYCRIDEDPKLLQLAELAIDVSRQGRGIGSLVLAHFKDVAARRGKNAQLNVMRTNTRARALYERMGFSIYGETPTHHLMRYSPPFPLEGSRQRP